MIGIIWYYQKKQKADDQLDNIIKQYSLMGIKPKEQNRNMVIFDNDDKWEIRICNRLSTIGLTANIQYVDKEIPIELVYNELYPISRNFLYNGFNYY